jgi:hypothetical protein
MQFWVSLISILAIVLSVIAFMVGLALNDFGHLLLCLMGVYQNTSQLMNWKNKYRLLSQLLQAL